jgi:hypothetical protein
MFFNFFVSKFTEEIKCCFTDSNGMGKGAIEMKLFFIFFDKMKNKKKD